MLFVYTSFIRFTILLVILLFKGETFLKIYIKKAISLYKVIKAIYTYIRLSEAESKRTTKAR